MTNRPRRIGTEGESNVLRALKAAGLDAHRVVQHGNKDQGDIHAVMNGRLVVLEVKAGHAGWAGAASTGKAEIVGKWLDEADHEAFHAGALRYAVVMQTRGCGDAADWWCAVPLGLLADVPDDVADVIVRLTLRDLISVWRKS